MTNLIEKGKKALTNINFQGVRKHKLAMCLFTFLMVMILGNVNVYANGLGALDNFVELIYDVTNRVGIIITIFAVIGLIISITQDNPQVKLASTWGLVAGIGIASIELVMGLIF